MEILKNKMSVVEALKAGMTEEQLLSQLREEIGAAKADISREKVQQKIKEDEERRKKDKIAAARSKLANAVIDFMESLEIFNKEELEMLKQLDVEEFIKEEEDRLFTLVPIMNKFRKDNNPFRNLYKQ